MYLSLAMYSVLMDDNVLVGNVLVVVVVVCVSLSHKLFLAKHKWKETKTLDDVVDKNDVKYEDDVRR